MLNHLSEELANVTSRTCGLSTLVDPDGSSNRLETKLMGAIKSLRKAEPNKPWEFESDGSVIASSWRRASRLNGVGEPIAALDAFALWVSPQIASGATRRPVAVAGAWGRELEWQGPSAHEMSTFAPYRRRIQEPGVAGLVGGRRLSHRQSSRTRLVAVS